MNKLNIALGLLLIAVVSVIAAGDGAIWKVGTSTNYAQVNSDGSLEASGGITSGGTLTASALAISSGTIIDTPSAASWTNGQAVTASDSFYLASGIGGANDTTNTITLANPTLGQLLVIVAASTTTNLIQIADSGNVAASGAILLDANDSAMLYGAATNLWVLLSESDN